MSTLLLSLKCFTVSSLVMSGLIFYGFRVQKTTTQGKVAVFLALFS